jgi:tetratricopeptide (TPR) repeat protein
LALFRERLGDLRGSLEAVLTWASLYKVYASAGVAGDLRQIADAGVPRTIRALGAEAELAPAVRHILTLAGQAGQWQEPKSQRSMHLLASGCHCVLGLGLAKQGRRVEAEAEYDRALHEAQAGGAKLEEAEAHEAWGELLASQGELEPAEAKLDAAAQARTQIGDEERKLSPQPLGLYAQVKYGRGKLPEAIKLEEQALKGADAAKDLAGQAEALVALAALYHESGKSEDGLRAGEKAAELTKQLGSREADAATRTRLAGLYYDLGDRDEAEAIEKGLRPLRRSATSDWAAALRRSAQAKYRAGDFQGAIKLLKQAQKMDETLGRKLAVVDDLNGLAACQLALAQATR